MKIKINKTNKTLKALFEEGAVIDIPNEDNAIETEQMRKADAREHRRVRKISMDIELCDIEIKKWQEKKKKLIDLKYKRSQQ